VRQWTMRLLHQDNVYQYVTFKSVFLPYKKRHYLTLWFSSIF